MPTISIFFGIVIAMYWTDHFPPHFHAYYGEFDGLIDIKKLEMIKGNLPNKALELILEWAQLHQAELVVDWNLCQEKQQPNKIAPL
jgi:hypothetical protein